MKIETQQNCKILKDTIRSEIHLYLENHIVLTWNKDKGDLH